MRNRRNRNLTRLFARRGAGAVLRLTGSRPIIAFLAMLAIALQSFVVQTHIHNPQSTISLGLAKSADKAAPAKPDGKFSTSDDTSNCRLCQELAHAGRFVAPSSPVLVLPMVIAWLLIVFSHSTTIPARAYVWRSRAPPAHS
jgi:hypothetical protein